MSELPRLRTKIDALDRRIVALLNQRLATAGRIGELKAARKLASYSPARTAEIIRNVQRVSKGPHLPAELAAIYRKIIAASVALQKRQKKTAGGALGPDSGKASRRKAAPTADPISETSRKK